MNLDETKGADEKRGILFVNGNVITAEPGTPIAQAFCIQNGRFVCVGTGEEAKALAPSGIPTVDLEGATVLPGLVDCHLHLLDYAQGRLRLELSKITASHELTEIVAERARALPPGEWVVGQGWNDTSWKDRRPPHRNLLDSVTTVNPVFLVRVDVHTVLVNSLALKMARVTRDTPDPPGGRIERDPTTGEATGVLVDNARALVQGLVPEPSSQQNAEALAGAMSDLSAQGLTAVHDAMSSLELLRLLREMDASAGLSLRVHLMLDFEEFKNLQALSEKARDDALRPGRVTVRMVKVFADGALGSRGALLSEPYSDDPDNRGVEKHGPDAIVKMLKSIFRSGLQPAVHAIGDLANRHVLDAYERCEGDPELRNRFWAARPRLEHAQIMAHCDVPRCGQLGLIVSIQPSHLISDMPWTEERLGPERANMAFLWGSMARAGARLVSGSDLPVESSDPFRGMYAAVARRNLSGEPAGGWLPEERLTRDTVLRSYTIDAAYAAFEENSYGSIAAGKFADFVVVDRDVLSVPEDDILNTRVLATFSHGRRTA